MSWMPDDNNSGGGTAKPIWEYRDGMEFLTVLENQSLPIVLLSGDLDPTKTWQGPMGVWLHEFKGSNGFVTIACNKWNEACPFCYENEIYKKQNPNYKNMGGRLPFGLSKKALIQVYVPEYKKVLWFLAGKRIQEGMDFIITQHAQNFNNQVMITRTGRSLNTSYRVDLAQVQLTQEDMAIIQQNTTSIDQAEPMLILSQPEVLQKSGVNSTLYFSQKLPQNHGIDISGWGPVPQGLHYEGPPAQQAPPAQVPPATPLANTGMPSAQPVGQVQTSLPASPPVTSPPVPPAQGQQGEMFQLPAQVPVLEQPLKDALGVKCTVGVYVNQTLEQVFRQTGKPYAQYLVRSGSDAEQAACNQILESWPLVEQYLAAMPF